MVAADFEHCEQVLTKLSHARSEFIFEGTKRDQSAWADDSVTPVSSAKKARRLSAAPTDASLWVYNEPPTHVGTSESDVGSCCCALEPTACGALEPTAAYRYTCSTCADADASTSNGTSTSNTFIYNIHILQVMQHNTYI